MNARERLLTAARRLPGAAAADLPRALDREASAPLPPDELRASLAALLARLAEQVADELPRALARSRTAWDQVDAVTLVDDETLDEARRLRRAAAATADGDAESAAAALTLDAAVGLALLVERRLAALMRAGAGDGDGPLVELGAALAETAKAWA
jgi:hypothetical protein